MERVDVDKVPYDRKTFLGRLRYFAWITDPRLSVVRNKQLLEAKDLLQAYREKREPPYITEKQLRRAQQLYLSAFHPDTGELQNVIGRMSFQVPGGMVLIGALLTFYKSTAAVIFWQWTNQSFNALVNYTNRNAKTDISTGRLITAYISATTCAVLVALGLKRSLANYKGSPVLSRLVPFAAVAAANAVNIPLMRQSELTDGVLLYDKNGKAVTKSQYAAIKGISQVFLGRIAIAAPSMVLLPLLMERLEVLHMFQRMRGLSAATQVLISGLSLVVMVPVGCAIFDQNCSINSEKLKILDKENWQHLQSSGTQIPEKLYFNKGL